MNNSQMIVPMSGSVPMSGRFIKVNMDLAMTRLFGLVVRPFLHIRSFLSVLLFASFSP